MPEYKKAKVLKNDVIASTYHDLWFEVGSEFKFEPGQFVSVRINEQRINSYSIAGRVDESKIGLLVDVKPGGPGSQFFAGLKVGDEIEFLGPLGKFVLKPDDGSERLIFLGTGSGIAPLKCMVESALHEHEMKVPMDLWFGLRHEEDCFWGDYFGQLHQEHSNFSYKHCLSKPGEGWRGLKGHITDYLKKEYPDASMMSCYLCGAQAMIEEASEILKGLGMPVERIYHEKFY